MRVYSTVDKHCLSFLLPFLRTRTFEWAVFWNFLPPGTKLDDADVKGGPCANETLTRGSGRSGK